ncbi:hypothetical protein HanIR_Chr17g0851591 [Helianthus annuus]|nr:hypothetical protein HanIR_Chr17g0851591 [Helianthus annuus]
MSSEIQKVCRYILSCFSKNIYQLTRKCLILLHEESVCNAFFTSPTRSSNSVDIILCGQREAVVNYNFNIWNIQPPSSYICSDLHQHQKYI